MITRKIVNPAKVVAAVAVGGALSLLSVLPAAAQDVPSYAAPTADQSIQGTIAAVNGPYSISVRDVRGYIDNVTLHQGTIINPTGLELAPGQSVTIAGSNQGSTFAANEIDTPYPSLAAVPAYYGYPYGPAYRVGLRFGRGFGFGFRG